MEIGEELKRSYARYAKKYALPPFAELNDAFELNDALMHEGGFIPQHLLRFVRRRIINVLDSWGNYLHSVLLPGENLVLFEESNSFTEKDKEEVFGLLRRLMRLNRRSIALELEQSEEQDAAFIVDAYEEWQRLCDGLRPLVEKSLAAWDAPARAT